jgi:DNA helicase-2/ATP-dependent DNA helicase PcrA
MVLSDEQRRAVGADGHVVVTACPGSGKTRVLTCRVLRGLNELQGAKQRVIALTFTNRAADEIQHRLDALNVPTDCLWSGTIHSFALEWILRPYAPYSKRLRHGFSVADEHYTRRLIEEAKRAQQTDPYLEVRTTWPREGKNPNEGTAAKVFEAYKERLKSERLLDYDDVLFAAYRLLAKNAEIRKTLASIMPVICVDEVQDIQDMQYAILSQIVRGDSSQNTLFFVGDANQSIYENLGALTKTPNQIAAEFGLSKIAHLNLSENYRSTQRLVDYFTLIRSHAGKLKSVAAYSAEAGEIKFFDQTVSRKDLAKFVAQIIRRSLDSGVSESNICVIAPRWEHIITLARALMANLPDVDFDAPGLSPLHSNRDDVWFKLARLFLTGPRHGLDRTRHRWANDLISTFESLANIRMPEPLRESRGLLRFVNSTTSPETNSLLFLRAVFGVFLQAVGVGLESHPDLMNSHANFFDKAETRIDSSEGGMPSSVNSLKKLFKSPAGVVVNTCHGVKGEEYHTVIALGLLHGYVPHWNTIINGTPNEAKEQASKLLYVVCSRAKRNLFLIAESGRSTRGGNPYETTTILQQLKYAYDT